MNDISVSNLFPPFANFHQISLRHPTLPCLVLSCLVLSCLVLSCLVLSCLYLCLPLYPSPFTRYPTCPLRMLLILTVILTDFNFNFDSDSDSDSDSDFFPLWRYCSKELIVSSDGQVLDLRQSDIFSLGASVYEMCLGRELGKFLLFQFFTFVFSCRPAGWLVGCLLN